MKIKFVCFILALVAAGAAGADELFEYHRPTRALGMGGVYLPFVRETDAVEWNPAALAEVSGIHWQVIGLDVGGNPAAYNEYTTLKQANCTSNTDCYSGFFGVPIWLGLQGATSLALPHMGVTAFDSFYLQGVLHNPAFPDFTLTYLNDTVYEAGFGMSVLPGLDAGMTVKRINRIGGTQDISLSTVTSGGSNVINQFNQRGTGYGFDLAAQWKIPFVGTLAAQWQDVGGTSFTPDPGVTAPDMVYDNLSIGLGTEIDVPLIDFRTGIEYRHITTTGEEFGKKIHLGAELGLPLIDVQVGLNEGYPTLGAGIDLWLLRVEAAHYTEETGTYPGQLPSERYQVTVALDISLDADFNVIGKDGRRRHLKERR